jgi:zinc transport system substrate-binding protein
LTTEIKCNIFALSWLEFVDWPTPFNGIEDIFLLDNVKTKFIHMLAAFGAVLLLVAANTKAENKLHVFVSLPPQKYFVQQIGQALVDVEVMVPAGADPHIYEPKPRQMVALSKARLYFAIGIQPFENTWLKKIASSNPDMLVVHTDRGVQKIPMTTRHHEEGQHAGELDPHIWLSPPLVMKQAQTILNALLEIDPASRAVYAANYQAFISELAALDAELKNIFTGKQGLQFMVLHPAWGYFAHTYGLKQVPVEIEGKDPKPAQLKELIDYAKQTQIKIIFVQPQFSPRNAKLVAKEIGGHVVFADSLAANWSDNLREVAGKLKSALK